MSAGEGSGAGRREVAYRVFAAEYDDADFQYTENEADERAPNYVVTPTGARMNRLFVVGVLTEVERVNDEMLRGRIVDPTGAFVVYAGQYQPDALTALERLDPPAFVAVTGKARTFQPEDAETIYTSVRPESINEVDADTRDRWTVGTARHTLNRVVACADGMAREEHGEELTAALSADGVDHSLAAGVPLALDHYGTTPAYLDAVREMTVEAVEVVADEREEVTPLGLAPGEGGAEDVDLPVGESFAAADLSATAEETSDAEPTAGSDATASVETATESASEATDSEGELGDVASGAGKSTATADGHAASDGPDTAESEPDTAESEPDTTESEPDTTESEPGVATDEMYQFDEDEREEIMSEFGTDFSTGAEVDEPGESDLDAPEPGSTEPTAETEPEGVSGASEQETGTTGEPEVETGTTGEPEVEESAEDVDLEDAVVETMRDLDSGDGADRNAVIEAVSDEHGADPEEVEDAIQDALMSGTCYEPGDGLLKAI
jgi:RPA family protein